MIRLVIAIAIAIVIAGSIIFIIFWAISQEGESSPIGPGKAASPTPPETVPVSINAIPWARVFIRLPQGNNFIAPRLEHFTIRPEPNDPKSNVTPIRGALVLPEETEIKLVYQEKEKIFPYEEWKGRQTISHDFSGQ